MSAVTAVPLRPLARGSVLKLWVAVGLLVLAAAGIGWWGTGWMQTQALESGARYRVLAAGTGPAFTEQDAAAMQIRLHLNAVDAPVLRDTAADEDGAQPVVTTFNQLPPGMRPAATHFRAGGRYVLWIPAATYLGGPVPPGAPFTSSDTLVLEVEVLQIAAGQAMALEARRMQAIEQRRQMMEQMQQGGNSAAPAPAPGAPPAAAPSGPAPGGR